MICSKINFCCTHSKIKLYSLKSLLSIHSLNIQHSHCIYLCNMNDQNTYCKHISIFPLFKNIWLIKLWNILLPFEEEFASIFEHFFSSKNIYWTSWGKSSASSGGISSGGLVHFINVSGDRYKNTNLANRSSSKSSSPLSRTRYMSRHNCNTIIIRVSINKVYKNDLN